MSSELGGQTADFAKDLLGPTLDTLGQGFDSLMDHVARNSGVLLVFAGLTVILFYLLSTFTPLKSSTAWVVGAILAMISSPVWAPMVGG